MVNYQQLLYVLERVKAACATKYAVFYAHGEEEEACCRQLEHDGLIQRYVVDEDSDISMWRLV